MVKFLDSTFLLGTVLVVAALAIAFAAVTRDDLPIIGTGVGALLAVGLVGMAGCAVGGISQAPTLGWTNPTIIIGSVLGVLAVLIILAGVFGWSGVLQPVAGLLPGGSGATLTTAQLATVALGALIAVKYVIAFGMAALARS
jgi:hypothetical protein